MFAALGSLSLGSPICEMWVIILLPRLTEGLSKLRCARSSFNAVKCCVRADYHEWWQCHYFKVKGGVVGEHRSKDVGVCRAAWRTGE